MIRRFLGKVFSGQLFRPAQLKIIPFKAHRIARERISRCAATTCEALQQHGFAAYVVGGAVRDLLLGREPKDYDVATGARPEQVRAIFRRSRIIGRRFRLVHVMCGNETVEVSTFRGPTDGAADDQQTTDEHGRILRDNVFGTVEEDARRRDFTVNAMFYDPVREEVHDYHDGVADIKARKLRMIGDAARRYREDPIRMLRAVRLAASRGLEIESRTRRPIRALADLLHNVPQARVFDEMMKLLLSGHAAEGVRRLRKEGLHHGVLPLLDVILEQSLGERLVMLALANTDQRINADKSVSPGFLFAALLWHEVLVAWKKIEAQGMPTIPALYHAMDQVLQVQAEKLAIPRRFGADMKDIWALQPRFLNRSGRRPYHMLGHMRFRAGYDFLLLRCTSGEIDAEIGDWWERFQHADEATRAGMLLKDTPGAGKKRRRRSRRRNKPAVAAASAVPE
ncbi:MAG: polynucleotide adenylyltransferase PcnB [Betaproteobacteria bacterium]|nr:polynucleotide adenylyltransferase PcnB [Betaproteobacteria bacterium]